jgi:O-succinylbenzoic acid--CoA ligase
MTCDFFRLSQGDSALLCLPLDYIAGKMMVVRALERKLNLVLQTGNGVFETLQSQRFSFSAVVPYQLHKLYEAGGTVDPIEKLLVGGAPLSAPLRSKLTKSSSLVYESFGMTETYSHIALRRVNPEGENFFRTLPGITVEKDNRECLTIIAPHLGLQNLQTNERIEWADGRRFSWLGRQDNVINSGGIKISPEQLEAQITAIIQHTCLVFPEPDERLGQRIAMVVEASTSTTDEIMEMLRSQIDKKKLPRVIYLLPAFVRTASRKINREATINRISL